MRVERVVRRWRGVVSVLSCGTVLAAAPVASAASQGTASAASTVTATTRLMGVVRDTGGRPVQGAQVSAGELLAATTGPSGAFDIARVPRGLVTLSVRRLGFRPLVTQWDVDTDSLSLDLRLMRIPTELPAVHVLAKAQPFDSRLAGFNARRDQRIGYYVTRAQIENRSDHVVTDALREVPGIRLRHLAGGGSQAYVSGSRCAAMVFVDGFPASAGGFDLNGIDLDAVEGIEVYPNASSMPSEFIAPGGGEQCGVVALWLSPMRPRVRSDAVPREDQVDVKRLIASHEVYVADSVEQQASLIEGTTHVEYPDSLFRAGAGGQLFASFVVDTAGEVELRTLEVKSAPAPAPAFVKAIRNALRSSEFKPARIAGQAVRQLVVLPFLFDPHATAAEHASTPEGLGARIPWDTVLF